MGGTVFVVVTPQLLLLFAERAHAVLVARSAPAAVEGDVETRDSLLARVVATAATSSCICRRRVSSSRVLLTASEDPPCRCPAETCFEAVGCHPAGRRKWPQKGTTPVRLLPPGLANDRHVSVRVLDQPQRTPLQFGARVRVLRWRCSAPASWPGPRRRHSSRGELSRKPILTASVEVRAGRAASETWRPLPPRSMQRW